MVTRAQAPTMPAEIQQDETFPTVEFHLRQSERGRWFCDRQVTLPNIDLEADTVYEAMAIALVKIDQVAREHIKHLYEEDAREREAYFRSREQHGGSWDNQQGGQYR